MSKTTTNSLGGVSETLLITLGYRANESLRPDALLRDSKAVEMANRLDYDLERFRGQAFAQLVAVMRMREFDRYTRAFMAEHPNPVVVDIGCGLDTRFDRLDDGRVEWYDLDLPQVIAVRRELLAETPRRHFVAGSVLDLPWMDVVGAPERHSHLFLAEGVFPYLEPAQVQALVLALAARFPGSELIFDGLPRFMCWADRFHPSLKGIQARVHWGMKCSDELEEWAPGIRLLGEWHYFDQPEPRLGLYRLLRWIPLFGRGFRVVRYHLGVAATAGPHGEAE